MNVSTNIKKKIIIFIALLLLALVSVGINNLLYFNYGVNKSKSTIPYENLYIGDDHQSYEFSSVLFKLDSERAYGDYVEISHLNGVYNHNRPQAGTWKRSRLSFHFSDSSGIELVPNSVTLKHFTENNTLIQSVKNESSISQCTGKIGCNESFVLYYPKGIPTKIIEHVSFTLIINGKEKEFSYIIPLEYKFDYSFWGILMGV